MVPLPPRRSTARARRAASGCGRCSASSPTPAITGDHRRALPGAAAVELGHNFSLVHDDIEDGDVERRHRPTLWAIHGVPQAINTGDMLFSLSRIALHRLTDLGFPDRTVLRLMRLYDETCVALCEGQYLDIAMAGSDDALSVELLLRHDRAQDGGPDRRLDRGRRACSPPTTRRSSPATAAFGWALGLAFQLNDDLLGIWGPEQATGKEPTDVARKKKTLPVIYAFEHAGPEDRARLAALYANGDPTADEVAEIVAILERTGAREYTRDQARRYRDEALAELDAAGVVEPEARARLEEIIVSVISA